MEWGEDGWDFLCDLPTIHLYYYRRKRALLWDISQVAKNAVAYNKEDSLIVKHAKVLVQTLWKFIE